MLIPLRKQEIIRKLNTAKDDFISYCRDIDSEPFFHQPGEKWSIAQHIKHLVISANKTRQVYVLPKFIVRQLTGKPNRLSRSYDELVNKYKFKLQLGGRASGRFVPATISPGSGKEKILTEFSTSMDRLIRSIDKKWEDKQLDQYLAPHPLLGRITLRELGYFTIYHTYHHLNLIKNMPPPAGGPI